MQSLTLIIHLTGLLLFSPSSSAGAYPIEVLMPVGMQAHKSELGWHMDSEAECLAVQSPTPVRWVKEERLCYLDLHGFAVSLGSGGWPQPSLLAPLNVPLVSTSTNPVRTAWLTGVPQGGIQSRVELTSGAAANGCPYAAWNFAGGVSIFDNIVTWVSVGIPGSSLTIQGTDASGTSPLVTLSPTILPGTIELWIRNLPVIPTPSPTEAIHYADLYDLLGVIPKPANPTVHTVLKLGCERWGSNSSPFMMPGAPTCMPGAGAPYP